MSVNDLATWTAVAISAAALLVSILAYRYSRPVVTARALVREFYSADRTPEYMDAHITVENSSAVTVSIRLISWWFPNPDGSFTRGEITNGPELEYRLEGYSSTVWKMRANGVPTRPNLPLIDSSRPELSITFLWLKREVRELIEGRPNENLNVYRAGKALPVKVKVTDRFRFVRQAGDQNQPESI
ncbi:hypothetical protein AB0J72_50085 [Dactylosporangium sp. NPDC049742]|uniref:hypothetical protein n=1 Tax=Dactylosporangium sp. NPDC049742 TaxID=3154737 RepID=UPI003441A788